jgi:hypothetical protein
MGVVMGGFGMRRFGGQGGKTAPQGPWKDAELGPERMKIVLVKVREKRCRMSISS